MHTIDKVTSEQFREKGSKFIGYLFPIESKEEFEKELEEIVTRYPDATHHCYAWRIDPNNLEEFSNDDGEPGGTAGLPILNQLKSFEVVDAAVVVVRYYGGTNLGKSGLIDAYGRSAQLCLEQAKLKPIQLIQKVEINYPYSEQNTIEKLIHRFKLQELASDYQKEVTIIFACPIAQIEQFTTQAEQLAHRDIKTTLLEKGYL